MNLFALGTGVATLAFSLVALAHGGGKHYMGTVKAIGDGAITVATKEKTDVKIKVDAMIKYEKSGQPTSPEGLMVGERVVVHTAKSDKPGAPKAILVKFGAAPKAPPEH